MLKTSWLSPRIAPPAIWGRLPAHADFVRSGVRHGESEGWAHWIAAQGLSAVDASDPRAEVPAAFVLPPGTLAFAPSHFVIGVIAPSGDRAGRRHPLLVYQRVPRDWLEAQLAVADSGVPSWLFWLARAVARHTAWHAAEGLPALTQTVQALWALHAPPKKWWGRAESLGTSTTERDAQSEALLRERVGPDAPDDAAVLLRGVPQLHWADWPHRLFRGRAKSAFWQQNVQGRFTNASTGPAALWEVLAPWPSVADGGAGAAAAPQPLSAEPGSVPTLTPAPTPAPAVAFDLRDLALSAGAAAQSASGDLRDDPLGSLGLPRLPPHRAADALATMLAELPAASASTRASSASPIAAPADFVAPGDLGVRAGDHLQSETSGQWFDALHAEFLRVVRDPMQLNGPARWQGQTLGNAEVSTGSEDPREEPGFRSLIPGVTKKNVQEPIDLLIAGLGGEPVPLGLAPPVDILRLFAPESLQDVRVALPSLTRREHHALSPDSHMPTARRTAPLEDPS